jgi:hypothetical protein
VQVFTRHPNHPNRADSDLGPLPVVHPIDAWMYSRSFCLSAQHPLADHPPGSHESCISARQFVNAFLRKQLSFDKDEHQALYSVVAQRSFSGPNNKSVLSASCGSRPSETDFAFKKMFPVWLATVTLPKSWTYGPTLRHKSWPDLAPVEDSLVAHHGWEPSP